ncbi:VanZ family protein [Streptomyces calidiresistens]|uniref:VanZ family protein n=1 Tax=Streptomyces calidiresistens TaxID=1485586 RepID=A0A7W3T1S0_9ACTN|nr:VanZ family protein [Streptomyces calidiresistens]
MTAAVLTIAYLAVVAWLTLRPVAVAWVPPTNTRPFATIGAEFAEGPRAALRCLGGGLTLLAPLGVLFPLLGRRLGGSPLISFTRTVFAGAMISLALGLARSVLPSRQADVDALILNTLGVALVHLLCFAPLRRRFPGARGRLLPDADPDASHRDGPTRGRVVPSPFTETRFGGIADPDGEPEEGPGMTPISARPGGDRAAAGRGPGSPDLVRPA